jgi:hypothetical protein
LVSSPSSLPLSSAFRSACASFCDATWSEVMTGVVMSEFVGVILESRVEPSTAGEPVGELSSVASGRVGLSIPVTPADDDFVTSGVVAVVVGRVWVCSSFPPDNFLPRVVGVNPSVTPKDDLVAGVAGTSRT